MESKLNLNTIDAFWSKRAKMDDPLASRLGDDKRYTYDIGLIEMHIDSSSRVLDLGCGNCVIANALEPKAHSIVAVDKYSDFLRYCIKSPKVKTVVSDIVEFKYDGYFDAILIFGVLNYVAREEALIVYQKMHKMLAANGTMIIKHQMAIEKDVTINHFSTELNERYSAEYRFVEQEAADLYESGFSVETIDIYPQDMNKHSNTKHFALVCKKT